MKERKEKGVKEMEEEEERVKDVEEKRGLKEVKEEEGAEQVEEAGSVTTSVPLHKSRYSGLFRVISVFVLFLLSSSLILLFVFFLFSSYLWS